MPTTVQMSEKLSRGIKRDDTCSGPAMRRFTKKSTISGDGTSSSAPVVRRSPRFNEKAKPSAAIIEAKKNARQKQANKKQIDDVVRDIYQTAREAKEMVHKPTGIVYDTRMVEHYCLWDSNYPECPERFTRVLERCESLGLISRCVIISPREATESEILAMHLQEQIQILKATENFTDEVFLEKLSSKYDAIYIHPSSYRLSLLSAGSTIELVDAICTQKVQNGMAVVRPPGHHAMKSEYCGYCFFNNVALAVHHAIEQCGISRILIVDWDVHHGQATQQMFYDDPRVVYFSVHRYEHGTFWPNLRESNFNYVGERRGAGYNFNVPLNQVGMTDADYLAIFHQVLLPMAAEFGPELVVVSAGYDSALGDEKGEMEVTPACYAHLLSSLLGLANGKIAVVLEGGYCLKSLAEGAALTLRCLLGDPCPSLPPQQAPCDSIRDTILDVIYAHRDHWQCFQFQDVYKVGFHSDGHILNPVKSSNSNSGVDEELKNTQDNTNKTPQQHYPIVKFLGSEQRPEFYMTRNCYPVQSQEFINDVDARLNTLITNTKLTFAPQRVCFVYDERMLKHKNTSDGAHPEKPERISTIYFRHEEYGLLERCHRLQARVVSKEELLLLHTKKHIEQMRETKYMKPKELFKLEEGYRSVYLHPDSYDSACLAAGALLQVVDSVLNGESQSGIAIVRPPGHHAEEDEPCGFCVFNSVSLAAKYAVEVHGLKRVLLLDWDVHHGNGSQHMFKSDPRVLYLSLHRYDNGSFFPGSKDANYTVVGSGPGIGYNVNIPWNKRGISDGDYIAAFHQVVLPICYQFAPELVLISAGFDAAVGDPLGGCKLSPEAYSHMTHWLSALANGRIILSLEGGYNVTSISYAMTLCTKALLGDPLPSLQPRLSACPSAVTTIKNVIRTHSKYWSCLKFDVPLPKYNVLPPIVENCVDKVTNANDKNPVNLNKLENNNCLPATGTPTEVISNSFTKLNLNEEVPDTKTSIKSGEIMHSNVAVLDISPADRSNSIESPMDLSECSTNFVASSSNSSFEGESQAWSRVSSASMSESPEEMVIDNINITDDSNKLHMSKYKTERDFSDHHKGVFITRDDENCNIPQKASHSSESCILQSMLASEEMKENVNSKTQTSSLRPSTLPLQCGKDPDFLEERRIAVTGGTQDILLRTVADHNSSDSGASGSRDTNHQGGSAHADEAAGGGSSGRERLVDYLSDNMQLLLAGQMYAVVPLPSCPHLGAVREVPSCGVDIHTPCLECGSTIENWVCLVCYTVHCGRYINEHMMKHGLDTTHPLTLSFSDLSVWCYGCEAYIDNYVLYNAKNAVHRSKFGSDLPWCYGDE